MSHCHRNRRNQLKDLAVLMMILTYLLAILQSKGTYLHIHDSASEVSHDAEIEKDACHRTIYHGDLGHGCNHPSHLTKLFKKCSLCDGILQFDKSNLNLSNFRLNFLYQLDTYAFLLKSGIPSIPDLMNKGPPVV
ncbi:MAG: hypothetical protein JNK69_14465 [Saprospiraceae bacterium]|nr:hypothetical protein [Saprospiraceae bacterium]